MNLPRDVSGNDLVKALRSLAYLPTRQSGSHIRLTTEEKAAITLRSLHDSLKLGTLASILDDVAEHHGMTHMIYCCNSVSDHSTNSSAHNQSSFDTYGELAPYS